MFVDVRFSSFVDVRSSIAISDSHERVAKMTSDPLRSCLKGVGCVEQVIKTGMGCMKRVTKKMLDAGNRPRSIGSAKK